MIRTTEFSDEEFDSALEYYNNSFGLPLSGEGIGGMVELKKNKGDKWEPVAGKKITSNIDFEHFEDYETLDIYINTHEIQRKSN